MFMFVRKELVGIIIGYADREILMPGLLGLVIGTGFITMWDMSIGCHGILMGAIFLVFLIIPQEHIIGIALMLKRIHYL